MPLVRALRQGVHPIVVLLKYLTLATRLFILDREQRCFPSLQKHHNCGQPLFAGLDVRPLKPPSPHLTPAPEGSRPSSHHSLTLPGSLPFSWRSRSLSWGTGPSFHLLSPPPFTSSLPSPGTCTLPDPSGNPPSTLDLGFLSS